MMTARWDPTTYLQFAGERSRPFIELMARVRGEPRRIADLGCGPGHLIEVLHSRWPRAEIEGVDSSTQMIDQARVQHAAPGVTYRCADLAAWEPAAPVDLLVSSATLHWVPGHLQLLPRLAAHVAPGGTFAFSVPGNFAEPSHALLEALADEEPFASYTRHRERPHSHDAATYLDALAGIGWTVDAWETTYLHVLAGEDPVFAWLTGTGARPVLLALPDPVREEFIARFKAALRRAYPARPYGTVLPFRRIFVVAVRGV